MGGDKNALAAAVVGGYVLGRTKKGKLALAAVTYLLGRRFGLGPRELVSEGVRRIGEVPQVAELQEQLRTEGLDAARSALTAVAGRRMDSLTDKIAGRVTGLGGKAGDEEEEDDESAEEDEQEASEEPPSDEEEQDEEEPEEEEEEDEEEPPRRRRSSDRPVEPRPGNRGPTREPARRPKAKKAAPVKKAAPIEKRAAKKTAPAKKTAKKTPPDRRR